MAENINRPPGAGSENNQENKSSKPYDLPDSERDREELKSESVSMDLPDVKDIPGQEFVHVPPLGELADTTASSDDEEGRGIFDEEDEDVELRGRSNVTVGENAALRQTDYLPTRDADQLERASLDSTDDEGQPLNEKSFGNVRSGSDLDVPGSEIDDANERIGEEDEENNFYSLDDDDVERGS